MSAAAVILIRMRKIINRFREENATSPVTAIIPSEHGIRPSLIFNRLVQQRVLVPVNEERYYLDEEREAVVHKRRRTIAFIILILVVIGFLISMLTQR